MYVCFFHVFVDGVRVVKGEVLFKVWMFLWLFLSGNRYHLITKYPMSWFGLISIYIYIDM